MLKQSIKSLSLEDYSVSKRKKKKEKEKGVCVNKKKKKTHTETMQPQKKTPRILLTTRVLLCSEHSVSGVGHVIYFSILFKDKGLLHAFFFFKGRKKQKG